VPAEAADDNFVVQPKDGLVCVQWYQPVLDKLFPTPDSCEQCIIMLYALVASKPSRKLSGARWVDTAELQKVVHS